MSTIRVIYEKEPNFPATDQHPLAQRYYVLTNGSVVSAVPQGQVPVYVIDSIGEPTAADITAVLGPAKKLIQ